MASGTIFPPGQTPESPEARDARIALENVKRDAERRAALDEAEVASALRVHLPVTLVNEAAEHGMEFVMEERRDAEQQKSGE